MCITIKMSPNYQRSHRNSRHIHRLYLMLDTDMGQDNFQIIGILLDEIKLTLGVLAAKPKPQK